MDLANRSRFERLVLVHVDSAFRLAQSILRCTEDAEDAVQEAFLRAFVAFERFVGEDARPWLLTIVRNAALQKLAQQKRAARHVPIDSPVSDGDPRPLADHLASDEPDPERQVIGRADRETVAKALNELSVVFREVLILREFENLSYSEIAEIVGVPTGTIMSRLSRARSELKRVLLRMEADG